MDCLICEKELESSELKCKMCGMTADRIHNHQGNYFCSEKCMESFRNIQQFEENEELIKREIVI